MKEAAIDNTIFKDLNFRYQRESKNVCFNSMLNTILVIVGLGASGPMIEQFARLCIKKLHLFDKDTVEGKNLPSQSYISSDIGLKKTKATKRNLLDLEFETGNPNLPPLEIETHGDFLTVSEDEIRRIIHYAREIEHEIIFILTTDYHPADARANRIALKWEVPVFWVSLYRMGKAGEIVFYMPGHGLPCYRCITESRYNFFDKARLANHLKGDFSGSGRSAGLPMAATFVDSILGHLVIGYIHRNVEENQHGKLFRRLLREKRNFIQCQMDPDYRLNGEDIFSQIQGNDIVTFNTIFQQESKKEMCIDCVKFSNGWVWNHTDYTRENYREILKKFSELKIRASGSSYKHLLLTEYSSYFDEWERI